MDNPAPQQTVGASLMNLEPELLLLIVDLLPATDIKSLRLVNSHLENTARHALHREIKLQIHKYDFEEAQARFSTMQTEGLLRAVRRFEVVRLCNRGLRCPPSRRNNQDKYIKLICSCLSQMSGLKDFVLQESNLHVETFAALATRMNARFTADTFNVEASEASEGLKSILPSEILTALATRPNVRFTANVLNAEAPEVSKTSDQLQSLKHNKQLYSLKVLQPFILAEEEQVLIRTSLRDVLFTCPNMRKLKLYIGIATKIYGRVPTQYRRIGSRNGEQLAALEELDIVEYPFKTMWPPPAQSSQAYPGEINEDEYWAEEFDWSRLRKLSAPISGFVVALLPKLRNLEHLTLDDTVWDPQKISSVIAATPAALKCLEIDSMGFISWDSIAHHGNSLQRLRIHNQEQWFITWNRNIPNYSHILNFRKHCPHIEELALDIHRDGDWPWETLDVLASFPRLHSLELWFKLGTQRSDEDNLVEPYLTFATVGKLFRTLQLRNAGIRRLKIHSGAAKTDNGFGYPPRDLYCPRDNTATFECHLAATEEEASQGLFSIACTILHEDENSMLRRMLARYLEGDASFEEAMETIEEDWHALDAERLRVCKVAWEGPAKYEAPDFDYDSAGYGIDESDFD